jgi:hypothetical protein
VSGNEYGTLAKKPDCWQWRRIRQEITLTKDLKLLYERYCCHGRLPDQPEYTLSCLRISIRRTLNARERNSLPQLSNSRSQKCDTQCRRFRDTAHWSPDSFENGPFKNDQKDSRSRSSSSYSRTKQTYVRALTLFGSYGRYDDLGEDSLTRMGSTHLPPVVGSPQDAEKKN